MEREEEVMSEPEVEFGAITDDVKPMKKIRKKKKKIVEMSVVSEAEDVLEKTVAHPRVNMAEVSELV